MKQLIFFLLVALAVASCGQTKKKTRLSDCLTLVELENGKFGVETDKGHEVLPARYDSLRLQLKDGHSYYITAYNKSTDTETLFKFWYNTDGESAPTDSLFTYPAIISEAPSNKDGHLWVVKNEYDKYIFVEKAEKKDANGATVQAWEERQKLNGWDEIYSLRGIYSDDNMYYYLVKRDKKCAILDVRKGGSLYFPEIFEDIVIVSHPANLQLRYLCRRPGAKKYELYDSFYYAKIESHNGQWYFVTHEKQPICYFTKEEIDTITAGQSGPIYRYDQNDRISEKLLVDGFNTPMDWL